MDFGYKVYAIENLLEVGGFYCKPKGLLIDSIFASSYKEARGKAYEIYKLERYLFLVVDSIIDRSQILNINKKFNNSLLPTNSLLIKGDEYDYILNLISKRNFRIVYKSIIYGYTECHALLEVHNNILNNRNKDEYKKVINNSFYKVLRKHGFSRIDTRSYKLKVNDGYVNLELDDTTQLAYITLSRLSNNLDNGYFITVDSNELDRILISLKVKSKKDVCFEL